MPRIWVTLDYIDGRSKIKGPLYPDEIDLGGLLFRLNERDLATITFTNAEPLRSLLCPPSDPPGDPTTSTDKPPS